MLITLLSAFLQDVLAMARTEDFLVLASSERKQWLKKHAPAAYPKALEQYLLTVTPEEVMADVQALLPVLTASRGIPGHLLESTKELSFESYPLELPSPAASVPTTTSVQPAAVELSEEFLSDITSVLREIVQKTASERRVNGFIQAFSVALSEEVADAFDRGQGAFDGFGPQASAVLEQMFRTGRAVELGREIQTFLHDQVGIASPIVQSPYPFTVAQTQDMRSTLRQRYPGSFAIFDVEPSLAGGLRVFYKGALLDESWMTHVARAFQTLREDRSSIHS